MTYKCLNNEAPIYLSNFLNIYTPNRDLRSSLDQSKLIVQKANYKYFGERAFNFIAPNIWNNLPINIREAPSVSAFKSRLKFHFFSNAYL